MRRVILAAFSCDTCYFMYRSAKILYNDVVTVVCLFQDVDTA